MLDSSYETARRGIQSVHQKERERILRLREVLLSHEKDNLQVKLFASDARIQDLTATIWKLEGSLENSLEQNERAKREIRAKSREAEKLNVSQFAMMFALSLCESRGSTKPHVLIITLIFDRLRLALCKGSQ